MDECVKALYLASPRSGFSLRDWSKQYYQFNPVLSLVYYKNIYKGGSGLMLFDAQQGKVFWE